MKEKKFGRIFSIAVVFILLLGFIVINNSTNLNAQYPNNKSNIESTQYFKDFSVDTYGRIELKGRFNATLGDFLFSIGHSDIYKVGYDSRGDIVKMWNRNREYDIVFFNTAKDTVKEISVMIPGNDNDQLRLYEYKNNKVSKLVVYIKKIDENKLSQQMVTDQVVSYYYDYKTDKLSKITYKNYNKGRDVNQKFIKYSYTGSSLNKEEVYEVDNDGESYLQYYYTYSGRNKIQHKPDGDVIREYVKDGNGDYTIEYYPPIVKEVNRRNMVTATDKHEKGVKVGYGYYNGVIYSYSKIMPKWNGFSIKEYAVAKVKGSEKIVLENIGYTRAEDWESSTTVVQRVWEVLEASPKPRVRKITSYWLDKQGKNLFNSLPQGLKNLISKKEEQFIGAEYIVYGEIAQPAGGGPSTIVEIYDKDGEVSWCDTYGGYFFFIGKMSDENGLDYEKILIRSKGYNNYPLDFEIEDGERVIDVGKLYLTEK